MLLTKEIEMNINNGNVRRYEELGYKIDKVVGKTERLAIKPNTKILVKIEDIPKMSHVKVNVTSDNCGCNYDILFSDYNRYLKEDNKIYCRECSFDLVGKHKRIKTMIEKSGSFYDWCIENNRLDYLDLWDYELNKCSPKDVCTVSAKYYYFKCKEHRHKSEKKQILVYTRNTEHNISCNQCSSFAEFGVSNISDDFLHSYWDYVNNKTNPYKISYGSGKKVWIKCQNCKEHGSYEVSCHNFIRGNRCPFCFVSSGGEENVSSFLTINNICFEAQKTFKDLVGLGGKCLSYDFYLPSYNLLIEVQGEQHKRPIKYFGGEKRFKIQQEHDKRKKQYATNNNIRLLEIWYFDFNNINEILSKELNVNSSSFSI